MKYIFSSIHTHNVCIVYSNRNPFLLFPHLPIVKTNCVVHKGKLTVGTINAYIYYHKKGLTKNIATAIK